MIELVAISGDEAARMAAGAPAEQDNWARGFPREDDRDVAAVVAASGGKSGVFGSYSIVVTGQTIGTAGFYGPPDESGQVTIGYGMIEPEWGKGYGTEAVAALIEICRRDGDVGMILADTDLDNLPSQRVLEKNGFERVRTTGASRYFELRLSQL
ncbi:MAG TPA: GNAT family N-acetyltransferase [Streptosporangiaceae bacterium]